MPDAASIASPTVDVVATLEEIVDGDTVETSAGMVRIIGIDAPERGECGYDVATALVATLVGPGDPITLVLPEGQNPEDRYGRLLRYDSNDGYPAHPRESDYRAAQTATLSADGSVVTVDCRAAAG